MENENISNAKIMIIDDDVTMMDMLSLVLKKYGHSTFPFTEPISAIEALKSEHFDILIVNYLMSPVNGDKIIELIREFNKEIYIILMSTSKNLSPSVDAMRDLDIQSFFEKGARFDQLILDIQSGVKYINQLNRIKNMNLQLEKYIIDFGKVLLNTIDAKDNYTGDHSKRVSIYAIRLGEKIGLSSLELEQLKMAAYFHDIGKIGIPDEILSKTGKLTDSEYETMKTHSVIGANILSVAEVFKSISYIVMCHHERVDGKGYPNNLSSENIPLLSKILAICDTFDAITTKRSYKEELDINFALKELDRVKDMQLDKELTEKFIELINEDKENFIIKDIENYNKQ